MSENLEKLLSAQSKGITHILETTKALAKQVNGLQERVAALERMWLVLIECVASLQSMGTIIETLNIKE